MSDLSVFFAQNVSMEATEDFVVSDRFATTVQEDDGKGGKVPKRLPVPWKLRSMTEEENEQLRKAATKVRPGKGGTRISETDTDAYLAALVSASIIFPNLKDADLQKSYGVLGEGALLKKMLKPGEYGNLVQKIQELNGFDLTINDLKEEVKNS